MLDTDQSKPDVFSPVNFALTPEGQVVAAAGYESAPLPLSGASNGPGGPWVTNAQAPHGASFVPIIGGNVHVWVSLTGLYRAVTPQQVTWDVRIIGLGTG